jgi:CRP/FNR family transcriptional regulator, cyclic AMP receptor protein
MREERQVRLLSLIDVLEPLSEEELRELAQLCPDMSLNSGQDFYRPEQHNGGLFLIKEGHVRVYTTSSTGKETTLEWLGSSTVLWARRFEALHAHVVHVQAVEPSVVAFMSREALERFVLKKPEVGLRMMDLLAESLGSAHERLAEVAHKEVLSRLASHILRLMQSEGVVDRQGGYKLLTAYTHKEWGMMIGAGRVAVTRALRVLQESRLIETREHRLYVRSLEALQRIAERGR